MAAEPREFGPYTLLRRLGVGGMAETFEASRMGAGGFAQRVCLKRVLPAFSQDAEFVARFRREANLAAQLRHTNVVGVIDFGVIDGVHYMALELVDGVDLRSFLKSSPGERLSPEVVALIAVDLAYALEHAHETLVHRDVSPSNILISRSGETKLADFGIAKAIEDATATASRSAKGKIPYMSPEYMRGESIDGRSDLFSLGVVLFEAAAGVRPFDGAHDVETMQRILDGNRLSLADAAPELPVPLRELIERLIEVDADARIGSAVELVEALGPVVPAPSVRGALAATIEGHRGGPAARLHVRASEEDRDTELSRPPRMHDVSAEERGAPSPARPRPTGSRWVWATLLLLGLIGAVIGTERLDRAADAVSAPAAGPPPSETPALASPEARIPEPPKPQESEAAAPANPTATPRVAKGWLNVIVEPWGNVWIDGMWMGRAPVEARLSKGRHVVEVGREFPSKKRIVRVEPGTHKEVELSLSE